MILSLTIVYRLRLALTYTYYATNVNRTYLLKIHSIALKDTSKDRHHAILFSLVSNQWFQTDEDNFLEDSFC